MTTITATKARKDFFNTIKKAARTGTPLTITMDGDPVVVMMSVEEYESWMETLDVMSDPGAMADLRDARNSDPRDDIPFEEVAKTLGYTSRKPGRKAKNR